MLNILNVATIAIGLAGSVQQAHAAIAQSFSAPAAAPTATSAAYAGKNNGTITNTPVVKGKAFDRIIQIWLENTDFATSASSPVFQNLSAQGITLNGYYGVTHPSEPNYIAAASGDFFGLEDDAFYALPQNVSTIVDLLEAKNVSWSSYQENMPYDGFTGFNYTEKNYLNSSAPNYVYYVRKHNPLIIHDSVANVSERALRIRNFNDFAVDVEADALSQWIFVTPNLVNDAHDTTVDFSSAWLNYWLVPLLSDPKFNNNRTLILLTYDETETYTINNQVYTILLGGAIPEALRGTVDPTYYTHYSTLSSVEANWGLGSLGRGDTNKTMANVFDFMAHTVNYTNNGLLGNSTQIPLTNLTGVFPGPLNAAMWTPALAPNSKAVGAGGGSVFVYPGTNLNLTSYSPLNLTAMNAKNPYGVDPGFNYANGTLATVAVPGASATGTAAPAASSKAAAPKGSVPAGVAAMLGLVAFMGLI